MPTLLTLPEEMILHWILPPLAESTSSLQSLRLVHPYLRALVDHESIWRLKVVRELNLPALATARSKSSKSWKRLYIGIVQSKAYTWGEDTFGRLGVDAMGLHPKIRRLLPRMGVPFPFRLDLNKVITLPDSASVSDTFGAPVSLQASGWGFNTLTSKGKVIAWGQLHEVDFGNNRPVPGVVQLPDNVTVKSIACGRQHAVALAKQRKAKTNGSAADEAEETIVIEWRSWAFSLHMADVNGLSHSAEEEEQYLSIADADEAREHGTSTHVRYDEIFRKIVQVEAGWDFSVSLVSVRARCSATGKTREVGQETYFWKCNWVTQARSPGQNFGEEHAEDEGADSEAPREVDVEEDINNEELQQRASTPSPKLLERFIAPVRLKAFPGSTATASIHSGDSTRSWLNADKITQLAAGDQFIAALTERGDIYELDVSSDVDGFVTHHQPPLTAHPMSEDGLQFAEQSRRFYSTVMAATADMPGIRLREWRKLERYCQVDLIREELTHAGVQHIVSGRPDEQIRVTHISAHFKNFAACSVPSATAANVDHHDDDDGVAAALRSQGFVLLSRSETSAISPKPTIIPSLQGAGVIKVSFGDWHSAALTDDGRVLTWGQYSRGALGIWDSLPMDERDHARWWSENALDPDDDGTDGSGGRWGMGIRRQPEGGNVIPLPRVIRSGPRQMRSGLLDRIRGRSPQPTASPEKREQPLQQLSKVESEQKAYNRFIWQRLRPRALPESIQQPKRVLFDDDFDTSTVMQKRPDDLSGAFVFDIALSGWHSGALVLGNCSAPTEGAPVREKMKSLTIETGHQRATQELSHLAGSSSASQDASTPSTRSVGPQPS
ncbi:RCC1/BLIP-II [Tilletiaria anomala UBC 951]|uniref:RCC1/BLIP-II n=1 Tax=Tilletiaria anomala (strain ATCC 24038 / CBS 436.72 / UBC 951) TaxID=1037660 RepID=A0A066WFN6_TILAU|nr:RCC1/BLIP-II [Tilletiaria anomala UBC 951]KDN49565.1 RCC1/BLIP-II [Tilletiaria anomala UBC 951]